MLRHLKAATTKRRNRWQHESGTATNGDADLRTPATTSLLGNNPPCSGARARPGSVSSILKDVSAAPAQGDVLSVRAENVLKELAAELTEEDPPKGRWIPSGHLLRKLSYRDLQAARNCGPQTTDEIIRWARSQGVLIERPMHAGKSMSAMWRDIIARSSTGEITKAEIAEALERSVRRKNTRIPAAFQNLLVKVLNATGQ
ncbi:MAG: hypothetical protein ACXWKP_33710 [Bradyrhizobium sp.]